MPWPKKVGRGRALDEWVPTLLGEPIAPAFRVLSPTEEIIVEKQTMQWIQDGTIEAAGTHPYVNNIVLAEKKSGSMRVCIDCTPINKVTESYDWPLPRLQDLRHKVVGCSHFARLDLRSAFFRVKVPPACRPFTAFEVKGKRYWFRRMPFGLKTAPSTFQRLMDHHLMDCHPYAYWFIDDILVMARSATQLQHYVREVTNRLERNGHVINKEKSVFSATSLLFAGLWVSEKGVGPNLVKASELDQLQPPSNKKDLQSALGLVSYLRDFIPLAAEYTARLYPTKDSKHLSTTEERALWQKLKAHIHDSLCTNRHWRQGEDGDLYVDASGYALGATLIQHGRLVATVSRKLTASEMRYSATDREHLALLYAAKKMRIFLHQPKGEIRVWTDHQALTSRKMSQMTPRQARWAFIVNQWIPCLRHIKGAKNPADYVSRWALGGGKGGGKSIKSPSSPT